jgi:hypothetical protein
LEQQSAFLGFKPAFCKPAFGDVEKVDSLALQMIDLNEKEKKYKLGICQKDQCKHFSLYVNNLSCPPLHPTLCLRC